MTPETYRFENGKEFREKDVTPSPSEKFVKIKENGSIFIGGLDSGFLDPNMNNFYRKVFATINAAHEAALSQAVKDAIHKDRAKGCTEAVEKAVKAAVEAEKERIWSGMMNIFKESGHFNESQLNELKTIRAQAQGATHG